MTMFMHFALLQQHEQGSFTRSCQAGINKQLNSQHDVHFDLSDCYGLNQNSWYYMALQNCINENKLSYKYNVKLNRPLLPFIHYKRVGHLHYHHQRLRISIFVFSSSVPWALALAHSGNSVLEFGNNSVLLLPLLLHSHIQSSQVHHTQRKPMIHLKVRCTKRKLLNPHLLT